MTSFHAIEQDRDFRRRVLHQLLKVPEQNGTYWHITWPVARYQAPDALAVNAKWPRMLGAIRTRLDPFSDDEQRQLINGGYAIGDRPRLLAR